MNKLVKCSKIYNKKEINTIESLINIIYKELLKGEKYLEERWGSSTNNVTIPNLSEIIGSRFIPDDIKNYITTNIKPGIVFERKINGKNFKITFANGTNKQDLYKILDYKNLMSVWLIFYLLSVYSNDRCGKNINIYVFFTPFKKEFPKKKSDVIGVNNVNSGYSTAGCNETTTLVIFREEEWLKVLIHELFHNLNLDFSTSDIKEQTDLLQEHFGVKSDYYFFETYCEVWARILNICIKSFIETEIEVTTKERKLDYNNNFHTLMQVERLYTLIQASNILNRFKSYNDYKENSNVFCYYILTACLLNDYLEFLIWCKINNKYFIKFEDTPENIDKFAKLIISECHKKQLNLYLDCIKGLQTVKQSSLRMSII